MMSKYKLNQELIQIKPVKKKSGLLTSRFCLGKYPI
ncbi:hypothetical protein M472_02165 [Sphingobacterium paucimobilis HER1398]|uniref:Uncharacterized protein n=1 Tax=Sphingobacterium paucimobilis HER1398 TaxID=1346330 RepID=U2J4L0_9SPHI|nr:hypothetical protein M472_02165 [Sphingobacterium paucimobilis HER1398]